MALDPAEASEPIAWVTAMLSEVYKAHGTDIPAFALGANSVKLSKAVIASRTNLAGMKPKENLFSSASLAQDSGSKAGGGKKKGSFDPITQLVVMDRGADPVTPLLLQVTYAGILDAAYPNKEAAKKFMKRSMEDEELTEIDLAFESTDEVWCTLRGLALDDARPALKRRLDAFNKTLTLTPTLTLTQNLISGQTPSTRHSPSIATWIKIRMSRIWLTRSPTPNPNPNPN